MSLCPTLQKHLHMHNMADFFYFTDDITLKYKARILIAKCKWEVHIGKINNI